MQIVHYKENNIYIPMKIKTLRILKFSFVTTALLIWSNLLCKAQDTIAKAIGSDTIRAKLIFVGDVMGHMPVVNSVWVDSLQKYDYNPCFENVVDYLQKADLAVANLEVPLGGKPYSGYPQFSSPDELGLCLKQTGFDLIVNANNHAIDRGKKGLIHTLQVLDTLGLKRTGTFMDSADKTLHNPMILDVNKIKIAFLNYTYGLNGLRPESPIIVNLIDTAAIHRDIDSSLNRKADLVIVILHWGVEYERYPNREQQRVGEFIRKCGANAIIGAHPHVIQPVERFYTDTARHNFFPIVFSLGNFLSNQRDRYRDGGIIAELDVEKAHNTRITSVSYVPAWVYKGIINGKMSYRIIPPSKFSEAVKKYNMSAEDSTQCEEFYKDTRIHLNNIPEAR